MNRLLLVTLSLTFLGCTKLGDNSTVTLQFSMPSQKLSFSVTQSSGTTNWGARAVANTQEMKCIGVIVSGAADDLKRNQCTDSAGNTIQFGQPGGFVSLSEQLSVEVSQGSSRHFRVYATSTEPGVPCPTFKTLDPGQVAELREIGSAVADINGGESQITITPNFSGPTIVNCSGPDLRDLPPEVSRCNYAKAKITAAPSNYVSDHAFILLKKSRSISSYLSSVSSNGLAASLIGGWTKVNSHLVSFTSSGNLANDLDKLCDSQEVSFVEPVLSAPSGTPTQFYTATGAPAAQPAVPIVAALDTGVQESHTVFTTANALVTGWNVVNGNGDVADDEGHGTYVTGLLLSGAGIDILGTVATSPIKIMPIKVLDSSGAGKVGDLVTGILHAVDNGSSTLLLPAGSNDQSLITKRALAYAMMNDVLVVTGAGNSTLNTDTTPFYPVSWNLLNSLNVAAWNSSGLASFSNYGGSTVHLAAPGVSIMSTLMGDTFGMQSGTSAASAQVAGLATAVKAARPGMSMYQIRSIVLQNVTAQGSLNGLVSSGGLVNSSSALAAGVAASITSDQPMIFFPQ